MTSDDEDQIQIEAAREVDALTPSVPAIAPAVEARLGFIAVAEMVAAHHGVSMRYGIRHVAADGCPQEVHEDGRCLRGYSLPRAR